MRDAIPLVEALVGGKTAGRVAEVPLAENAGGIADVRELLCDGDFPGGQAVPDIARRAVLVQSRAYRVTPRHQSRPRRLTLGLQVVIGEPQPLPRDTVDVRRGSPAQLAAAVYARLTVAEVVHQHENDMRTLLRQRFVSRKEHGEKKHEVANHQPGSCAWGRQRAQASATGEGHPNSARAAMPLHRPPLVSRAAAHGERVGDGTTHIVFEPLDFIARLVARVPRPRVNLTRYHGVLAPSHRWRAEVTPSGRGRKAGGGTAQRERSALGRHAAMSCTQRA
jgi:hypothetical protein